MKLVQAGQCITCPVAKGDMEIAIRFILCSEAIDDLGTLVLGSPADTLSPEYAKWTTNVPTYIDALKGSLGIKTEEQEKMLNEAYKIFSETYKLG